ncbi:hypothetical protein R3W88_022689 [Solanum pinnatisectum]|uniref:Uncharacterized protein n=1 Tax=Solanum pinnatisectum TaxID=50273 RepID=A0AAV9LVB7_9SOLN|nr:hypothetical protein R3W88_022689 [Solanum pinnatisectum]
MDRFGRTTHLATKKTQVPFTPEKNLCTSNSFYLLAVEDERNGNMDDNSNNITLVKVKENAIDTIQNPTVMQTDDTQLWLGNAENSNTILHNIVSHNIEEVRGQQDLIENGDVDSSLVESHGDGDLSPRILKSIKSARKGKK